MWWEQALVAVAVGGALWWLAREAARAFQGRVAGCGCGKSRCPRRS